MKNLFNILSLILLSMLIGTPLASAQIVDEQGQYVDTTFHDNVDRTEEDFLVLGKDSIVDSILINIDSKDEVIDIVERGDSCEADTIGKIESKISFFTRYCYDKNRTLKENLWDWIAIGLMCLIVLWIIVVGCMHIKLCLLKDRHIAIQVLLILVIAFIAIYSDSRWVYLVLVALCVLGIFQCNNRLFASVKNVLKIWNGLEPTSEAEIQQKLKNKVDENFRQNNPSSLQEAQLKQNYLQLKDKDVEKYRGIERLALDYLAMQYPNLQRNVTLKMGRKRIELDGFIEGEDKNLIVEVKYCPSCIVNEFWINRLQGVLDFIKEKTKINTEILLFVVVTKDSLKNQVLEYFNNHPMSDYTPIVKVYIEKDLENLNNQKSI